MVDILFINILVCVINHCTLGCSISNEYRGGGRGMDVRKTRKSIFHTKRPWDTWGGFAGGHFKNQLKIDF